MQTFMELGLSEVALEALSKKGFTSPTAIQAKTIPLLLAGNTDIVGQAMTGSGKTAAFALPILERITPEAGHVQALILTPTRELALQVCREVRELAHGRPVRLLPVYGGQSMTAQLRGLSRGVDIVVGTPGRVLDHLERKTLQLDKLDFFVLDEADEMCSMGFIDDVRTILDNAGPNRRALLFSATMPADVMSVAKTCMHDHVVVSADADSGSLPRIRHIFHEMSEHHRFEALCRVIDAAPDFFGLVFCRTKADADQVADRLSERGYPAEPIHGDLSQSRREAILSAFRNGKTTILVATDVAARGIDVPDLTHVVNFALPGTPETYTHRVGRTGRAGKQGVAVSLINPSEFRKLMFLAKRNRVRIEKKSLPRGEEIVAAKKAAAVTSLEELLISERYTRLLEQAQGILKDHDAADVVASLLHMVHGDSLDPSRYRDIPDPSRARQPRYSDRPGYSNRPGQHALAGPNRVRLRARVGRAHGMTPAKLVAYISDTAQIHGYRIQHVKVGRNDSVFTVPAAHSDKVVKSLNTAEKGLVSVG
ncbi:DEAD/DEAH box helicase [Desulfovibrio inopinatus]|uniref:DEAD/DEAH box helicase n=1 Tax=Desulfovibrio inopinatus TaxID=102109 RepID=UPI00041B2F7B|nr:DEAD/DEAH box helicase [Desulfovibrio inopinatus]